jgi:hypothetical protein
VLDTLRADPDVEIPVFHDDQQGTATVLLSGLINALKLTDRTFGNIRVALVGMGAANVATLRLLLARGVKMEQIIATDSRGILHRDRADVAEQQVDYPDKWRLCLESNVDDVRGGIARPCAAPTCASPSPARARLIKPEWVSAMAKDSIVFPCSNRYRRCGHGTPRRRARASWARAAAISPIAQQLMGLPGHLSRCAGRARAHHHRRDVPVGGRRDRALWRGIGPGRTSTSCSRHEPPGPLPREAVPWV